MGRGAQGHLHLLTWLWLPCRSKALGRKGEFRSRPDKTQGGLDALDANGSGRQEEPSLVEVLGVEMSAECRYMCAKYWKHRTIAKAPLLSCEDLETGAERSRSNSRPAQEPIPSMVGSWIEVGCQSTLKCSLPSALCSLQIVACLLPWEEHNCPRQDPRALAKPREVLQSLRKIAECLSKSLSLTSRHSRVAVH